MRAAIVEVSGRWGHFRKPETNNNPLTHDLMTKTALIGQIGAVIGADRERMRPLFPQLSEDLRYGIALRRRVWKQSWSFTLRRFDSGRAGLEVTDKGPRAFEFLREPSFLVVVALQGERSRSIFNAWLERLRAEESCFEPVLGLHNCPAELVLKEEVEASPAQGDFHTAGFVPKSYRPSFDHTAIVRIGFERLPTYQNDAMWNPPDRYVEVVYCDVRTQDDRDGLSAPQLAGSGDHYRLARATGEEDWCLI